jgi:hypothetical protein
MQRRMILGAAAAMLLPAPALLAQPVRQRRLGNGVIDSSTQSFLWTRGGGDPLRLTPAQALALPRVRAIVPEEAARRLVALHNVGQPNRTIEQDDRDDFMVSGNGRVEHNVVAKVDSWSLGASRQARTIYYWEGRAQWRLTFYVVCGNIGVTRYGPGGPAVCSCEADDVCWKS